jgi:hypothetical protein
VTVRGSLSAREIALALGGNGRPDARGNFECHCPGPLHKRGDLKPSLSVREGRNGTPVLYCFVGCSFSEITAALTRLGLWPVLRAGGKR